MQVNRTISLAGKLPEKRKYRVAAYCRVSTELESQQSSLELQQQVYETMIKANEGWELAGIYADEGLSGTSVKHRTAFRQMIQDAENGKIDYIITKSISRFARNTLECLEYVRHLKDIGTQIYFEKENIDTGAAFSEMLLTILAAFAQEESRSISENVKWGIRKRFADDKPRWTTCYGYTKEGDEEYRIVEKEAEIVRLIFSLYECGSTSAEVTDFLEKNHYPTPLGNKTWTRSVVQRILANEKYCGDVRMQKKVTTDHLTHLQIKNTGQVPSYCVKNHHPPIISRKTFEHVTVIRELRRQKGGGGKENSSLQYPFAEMLHCPYCGSILHRKKVNVQKANGAWCCEECREFILRADLAEEALKKAYNLITIEEITELLDSPEKNLFLNYKRQIPQVNRTDYFWLDDLVEKIEFGRHSHSPSDLKRKPEAVDDNVVHVSWKVGLVTTVSTVQRDADMPWHVAQLYNAYLERQKAKGGVVA